MSITNTHKPQTIKLQVHYQFTVTPTLNDAGKVL